jgi:hypothetical protein
MREFPLKEPDAGRRTPSMTTDARTDVLVDQLGTRGKKMSETAPRGPARPLEARPWRRAARVSPARRRPDARESLHESDHIVGECPLSDNRVGQARRRSDADRVPKWPTPHFCRSPGGRLNTNVRLGASAMQTGHAGRRLRASEQFRGCAPCDRRVCGRRSPTESHSAPFVLLLGRTRRPSAFDARRDTAGAIQRRAESRMPRASTL